MLDLADLRVLVVAPHPDDEVIGCGGMISRVKEAGGSVFVHFLTVGDTADLSSTGFSGAEERQVETRAVMDLLGVDDHTITFIGAEHHLRLDAMAQHDLVSAIESAGPLSVQAVEPDLVLLPGFESYNQDHRAAARAAMTALRPTGGHAHEPAMVWVYEQPADQWNPGAVPTPNVYVSFDEEHLSQKLDALKLYASQWREPPNPRSADAIRGLAALRGAQAGTRLAEAFGCLRFRM